MSEEVTLDQFTGDNGRVFSAEPQGVRLALDESYPEEWGFAELEEVCEVNSGFTWNKKQETDSSEDSAVPVIKIGNVQDGYLDLDDILYLTGVSDEDLRENKARKDWLLMIGSNGSGERVGHCGIIEEDMEFVYASFLYGLHADSDHLLPRFLFYSLNRPKVQQRLTSFTAGSTSLKNLNKSTIENLSIPTPPLSEQRKIATVLYTVDRAIEKTEAIVGRLERIHKGLFQSLIPGGIGHEQYIDVRILGRNVRIPASWDVTTVSEACSDIIDYRGKNPEFSDGGIPHLRNINIGRGELLLDDLNYVSEETYDEWMTRGFPQEGDTLLSTEAPMGKTAVLPEMKFSLSQRLIVLRPSEQFDNQFFAHLMGSPFVQKEYEARATGSTVKGISSYNLQEVTVPVPPREEQEEITQRIDESLEAIHINEQKIDRLNRLKRGLMQDLLSGTVRTTGTNIQVPKKITQYG